MSATAIGRAPALHWLSLLRRRLTVLAKSAPIWTGM